MDRRVSDFVGILVVAVRIFVYSWEECVWRPGDMRLCTCLHVLFILIVVVGNVLVLNKNVRLFIQRGSRERGD